VNWEAISAIGQIVGALAVVISLIYVAREIRSNARAARTASMGNVNRWLGELVVNPHLGELWYRGIHDFGSLKNGDLVRFSVLMDQLFNIYQEMYYQRFEGQLDPRQWGTLEAAQRDINGYPRVQAWWRTRSHWYNKEFAKHIDHLQQTAPPPRLYREPMKDE